MHDALSGGATRPTVCLPLCVAEEQLRALKMTSSGVLVVGRDSCVAHFMKQGNVISLFLFLLFVAPPINRGKSLRVHALETKACVLFFADI